MLDFEKLGAFYLGKRIEPETGQQSEGIVLYDAKDLTTHAVIIGMTGSGKTGLGIGILEEAAIDKVPVIAIDPKGDMANLMLTFPKLSADDFRPWINPRQASDAGLSIDEFAGKQASMWKKGLANWGQDGKRISKLKAAADVAVYTPGSNAGLPISVLKSFNAPTGAIVDDLDLYRERVQSTATGVLALLGIDADPISSREHILISRVLDDSWQNGDDLDIASMIAAIQNPSFTRIGVMDIDSFFPAKDRFALSMRLNNLLAAPGFQSWMEGEALDAAKLLYSTSGKPRISVMSIAHLDDASRMFFVCMLLNEVIAWMRSQPGTGSLRAILYMDEIFGYLPPTANPASKKLFLTLLKQARAYGLGLVLATQNPVDLDYKALSNTGTWFIGRLQTERDKARVMEGLEGASQGGEFNRQAMERTLAGLGKRRFLLHNVHEDEPVVFGTRWVMSYLAGPMTRDQIKKLMAPLTRATVVPEKPASKKPQRGHATPALGPKIDQYFAASSDSGADESAVVYYPRVVAASEVLLSSARYNVEEDRQLLHTVELDEGPVAVDWDSAEKHELRAEELLNSAEEGARFSDCPTAAAKEKNYTKWRKDFSQWLRRNEVVTLYRCKKYKLTSSANESEGEFRARLQQTANEKRDIAVQKLRKRYASKANTLENRLLRAQQTIEREKQQSTRKKLDTAVSFGTAILSAVLGRKKISASSAGRIGTAIRSASGARKEAGDVDRARATAEKVRNDIAALEATLEGEVAELDDAFDAQDEVLDELIVKPKVSDINIEVFGLLWVPYRDSGDGRLRPAWLEG